MGNITQKWVILLMPFTNKYNGRLTESELSKISRVPQQTASRHLAELAKEGYIDYEIQGRNKLFYLDKSKKSSEQIYSILELHKSLLFQQKYKEASVLIQEILQNAESAIIFGSYASGKSTSGSDIDLVIFGIRNKKNVKEIKQKSPITINEHYVTYDEFSRLFRSKNSLSVEISKNHVLFGNVSKIVNILMEKTKRTRKRYAGV